MDSLKDSGIDGPLAKGDGEEDSGIDVPLSKGESSFILIPDVASLIFVAPLAPL